MNVNSGVGYCGSCGYTTGPGWDYVTGLGSLDAWNFAQDWASLSTSPTYSTGQQPSMPQGLAIGSNGNLWFADQLANAVGKFDPFTYQYTWYTLPTGGAYPMGIAVDPVNDQVWFTESGTGKVGVVLRGMDAKVFGRIQEYTLPSGSATVPAGLGIDPTGNVWVAEEGLNKIAEVSPQIMGPPSMREFTLPRQDTVPEGLAVDPGGNVWIACEGSQTMVEFQPASGTFSSFPVSAVPEQISIDPAGDVWFTENCTGCASNGGNTGYIAQLDPAVAVPGASPGNDPGLSEHQVPASSGSFPSSLAVDGAGNVFYTDAGNQTIGEYDPGTGSFSTWKTPLSIAPWPEGEGGDGLAVDGQGNVWYIGYYWSYAVGQNVGYLGKLAYIASPLSANVGAVQNGLVSRPIHLAAEGAFLTVPAATYVTTTAGMPFTGALDAPTPLASSLVPPSGGRNLVGSSAYNFAATSATGWTVEVRFSQPVTASFPVNLPAGTLPGTAQVWYYDLGSQAWREAGIQAGDPGGTVSGGMATVQTTHFTVFAVILAGTAPNISGLSPDQGLPGAAVQIQGTNLGTTAGSVYFGNVAAPVTSWTSGQVNTTVPPDVLPGTVAVSVYDAQGVQSNYLNFTVEAAPRITGITPAAGPPGTPVQLAGTGFGTVAGTVYFGSDEVAPTSWSPQAVSFDVPAGAPPGTVAVSVYTAGGITGNVVEFQVTAAPVLSGVSPAAGPQGGTVILQGAGFGTVAGAVYLGRGQAATTAWSDTAVTAVVPELPAGAVGVYLEVYGGPTLGPVSFTVTPQISAVTPAVGYSGTRVAISGNDFGVTQAGSAVTFDGTVAQAVYWSQDLLQVTVPSGAGSGPVVVTVNGAASNPFAFTVLAPTLYGGVSPGVPFTAQASADIGPAGGTLRTPGGGFALVVPPGALTQTVQIWVNREQAPTDLSGLLPTGAAYTVHDAGVALLKPAQVKLAYQPTILQGRDPLRMGVYAMQPGGTWSYAGGILERADGQVGTGAARIAGTSFLAAAATRSFSDLPQGYWARPAIDLLLGHHLIRGYPDGLFQPTNPITRAQFVVVLAKSLGLAPAQGASPFRDVASGAWYYKEMLAAYGAGLVHGVGGGDFAPQEPVTREEAAVLLAKAAGLSGPGVDSFRDRGRIAPWAVQAVAQDEAAGLIRGYPDGT
ncbi:MAG: IPT/TIG domain-containing protein, partial [Thermaerobacter sp.]|nr:IPT/TIG domain-containing protein [Thermaerobacter sp.]